MKIRNRKPAAERKQEIVETAIRLAAQRGPDRLTTEDLAKEIGISQPAIFRHFQTKSDIWEAVGQRIFDLMTLNSELDESTGNTEQLRALVRNHLTFFESTPAVPAILFSRELHSENEKLRALVVSLMSRRQKSLAALFSNGIEAGEFEQTLNPDDAAYLVMALAQGLAMRWSLNNRGFDLVEEGRKLLELQINGFSIR